MDTGDLHYCGKSIVGYGRFKCSRCGGRCYLSSGEMGERESDASIFEASKGLAYVLCDDCVRVITEQSIRGIVPQGLTPYHIQSEDEFRKALQNTAEDVASMLSPLAKVLAVAVILGKYKDSGTKPNTSELKSLIRQILYPTDTDSADVFNLDDLKRKEE